LDAAWCWYIEDLTGLEYCTDLTTLRLEGHIVDVSPLAGLSNLTHLSLGDDEILGGNQIVDVSPLAGLTNLTWLGLSYNEIVDVSPLAALTNLTHLEFISNEVSDVSPLTGLTNLTELWLSDNEVSDVSPLAGLTNLTGLCLYDNQVSDVSPLAANPGFGEGDRIDIRGNPLSQAALCVDIPALEARGVRVYYDGTCENKGER